MSVLASILKRWLLVSVLAVSLATPWAILQSVAWFGMVITYSQETSFARAVAMTFDGKHPCKLCHFIQQGQSEERQQPKKSFKADEKLQLGLPPEVAALVHPPVPVCPAELVFLPEPRSEPPPFPPPRFA